MLAADAVVERRRVSSHIARAERQARKFAPVLDPLRRLVRRLLLDELERYRLTRRFPQNPGFPIPTPAFIDEHGTRCAMAHLLEVGGERDLVQKIARERNFAYVRELADEPRLLAWLAAAGLTVAEAAAIQPAYCEVMAECVCADRGSFFYPVPAAGVLDGTLTVADTRTVRVDAIHGDGSGHHVGEEVTLASTAGRGDAGARVLIPVGPSADAGAPLVFGIILGDGTYTCQDLAVRHAPALTADQIIAAVRATDCVATLAKEDSAWSQKVGDGCSEGTACGVSGTGDLTTLGILLALTAVLVRRRQL